MISNRIIFAILVLMVSSVGLVADDAGKAGDASVVIYLPREILADSPTLTMAEISIISGDDELKTKIEAISIGRGPVSKEVLVIDRGTILSRLGSAGIDTSNIKLSGSKSVSISRNEKAIASQALIDIAEAFIKTDKSIPSGVIWKLASKPKLIFCPAGIKIELAARLGKTDAKNLLIVEVVASSGKDILATSSVYFRKGYAYRKIVATRDIPAGGELTPSNISFVEAISARAVRQCESPFMMRTVQAVAKGTAVTVDNLRYTKPKTVIRRNAPVIMKIEGTAYCIQMTVIAMMDGKVGELIKVKNTDSKKIIIVRVKPDGTVTPAAIER